MCNSRSGRAPRINETKETIMKTYSILKNIALLFVTSTTVVSLLAGCGGTEGQQLMQEDASPAYAQGPVNAGLSAKGFDKILKLEGVTFHVTCPNEGSLNDVTIVPSGLKEDNTTITVKEADGTVSGADVADLNKDGSPEIYVYVTSAGSGSYGSLIAYSANKKKSLSQIYLPPLEDDKVNSKGYMGHDGFSINTDFHSH